jgi:glycine oxidase
MDASTTIEAVTSLRERGARLVPSIADASVQRGIVGLRPASPDRLPLIGRIPGYDNAFIAAGHGRNGVLLSPITAKMARDLIIDGIELPESVDPARFARSA